MAPPLDFLRLVAQPQRWQLLSELAQSDRRVGELTRLLGKPQNLLSYHLGQLHNAGLVTARRSSADGRDTYYHLDVARCGQLLGQVGAALHPGLRVSQAPVPAWPAHPPLVLFLCTGNGARSQMAEALLEARSGHAIHARSAGSHPKALHPYAVRAMAERGIDISGRPTKHLRRFARTHFDRVITLCDKVKEICPEFPGHPTTAHWSIADPAALGYAAFVRVAEDIETRVDLLMAQLCSGEAAAQ